jgi:nucleotide-binding universal stress UspA family protein
VDLPGVPHQSDPAAAERERAVIVLPVDGSEAALRGLPIARCLADALAAHLHRVSVTVPEASISNASKEAHRDALALIGGDAPRAVDEPRLWSSQHPPKPARYSNVVGLVNAEGDADIVLRGPSVASALLDYVEERPRAVVCLTTHAHGGLHRRLVGSTTETLMLRSPCPVLAVGPTYDIGFSRHCPRTILVAAGGSLPTRTVPVVAEWARRLHARTVVVGVELGSAFDRAQGPDDGAGSANAEDIERIASRLSASGVLSESHTLRGGPIVARLLEFSRELEPPVMIAAPVGERAGRIPTDVTYQLLQRSPWPVLASVGRVR